jgi:hypothetical protein
MQGKNEVAIEMATAGDDENEVCQLVEMRIHVPPHIDVEKELKTPALVVPYTNLILYVNTNTHSSMHSGDGVDG